MLREVAWALAYAHGRGIVHRDVKPDNILLEAGTGRALVTDFGIAHGGATSARDTDPGKIMGTAHFMSPEQAADEPIDGRSDIYALGVVGYLAVSGRLPVRGAEPAGAARAAGDRGAAERAARRARTSARARRARSTAASRAIRPSASPTARRWRRRSLRRPTRGPRCRRRCARGSPRGIRCSSRTWDGRRSSACSRWGTSTPT